MNIIPKKTEKEIQSDLNKMIEEAVDCAIGIDGVDYNFSSCSPSNESPKITNTAIKILEEKELGDKFLVSAKLTGSGSNFYCHYVLSIQPKKCEE